MLNAHKVKLENVLARAVKYVVPHYQRNFEWKRDNAEEFWQDIQTPGTFLGTIVLNVSREENGQEIEIVDGQQRFTTIFILLAVLRTQAKNVGNLRQAQAIQQFISFLDNTSGEETSTKMIASSSVRDVFEETIANFDWNGRSFKIDQLSNKKRQVNKISPIYNFFLEKIKKFDGDDIKNILTNLYSSVFVEIEIQKTEDAFEIFERTNARGLDLNAADLLKNYLFSQEDLEDVEERWAVIVENSENGILRMIKHFYVAKKGAVRKRDLFARLKNYGEIIGANQFLSELVRFSYLYNLILKKSADDFIEYGRDYGIKYFQTQYNAEYLNRSLDAINLFGISQSYPLILKVLDFVSTMEASNDRESFAKQICQLVDLIEKYHFINSAVAQRPGNEVEKFYAEICEADLNDQSIRVIINKVKKKFGEQRVGKNEFVERFVELNYQNDYRLIFYINDRLNNYQRSGGQVINMYDSDSKALRKNYDLEHVVSQDGTGYEVESDVYDDLVHNIGNLIVISKHTNGGLGNKHVNDKLPIIKDKERQLPEAVDLCEFWKEEKWSSLDVIQGNIQKRAEHLASKAFDKVWSF